MLERVQYTSLGSTYEHYSSISFMESSFNGQRSGGRSLSTPKRPREGHDGSTYKESNLFLRVENASKRSRSNSPHDTTADFCGLQEHKGEEAVSKIESPQQADKNNEGNENPGFMGIDTLCDNFTKTPISAISEWERDRSLAGGKALLEFDTCFGTVRI